MTENMTNSPGASAELESADQGGSSTNGSGSPEVSHALSETPIPAFSATSCPQTAPQNESSSFGEEIPQAQSSRKTGAQNTERLPGRGKPRLLLVDDDPLTLRAYGESLLRQGFHVEVAADGFAALKALRAAKHDVVVLDLLMPKFSGQEVLRFIRNQSCLSHLYIIVLSNSPLEDAERFRLPEGLHRELLKSECTPRSLGRLIQDMLGNDAAANSDAPPALSQAEGAVQPSETETQPATGTSEGTGTDVVGPVEPELAVDQETCEERSLGDYREDLVANAEAHCAALHKLFVAFNRAPNRLERRIRLTNLFRKVHLLTTLASLADLPVVAQLAGAFEALLFHLLDRPELPSPSLLQTIASTIDFFRVLLKAAGGLAPLPRRLAEALVVDDDPLAARLLVSALGRAHLPAWATNSPQQACQWLEQQHFDLVLLDVEMPEQDGFELCQRLREMPGHSQTPVMFVTAHDDLNTRARAIAGGAADLITKPVRPAEIAVKAVMAVIKSRLLSPEPESSDELEESTVLCASGTL